MWCLCVVVACSYLRGNAFIAVSGASALASTTEAFDIGANAIASLPAPLFSEASALYADVVGNAFPSVCPDGQDGVTAPGSGDGYCRRHRHLCHVAFWEAVRPVVDDLDGWSTMDDEDAPAPCDAGGDGDDDWPAWEGVTCDESGRITSIILNDVGLRGQISWAALSGCDGLEELNLASNAELSSPALPDDFFALQPALRMLALNDVQLSGSVPPAVAYSSLVVLEAARSGISGELPLRAMPLLRRLRVNGNAREFASRDASLPAPCPHPVLCFVLRCLCRAVEGTLDHDALAALNELNNINVGGNSEMTGYFDVAVLASMPLESFTITACNFRAITGAASLPSTVKTFQLNGNDMITTLPEGFFTAPDSLGTVVLGEALNDPAAAGCPPWAPKQALIQSRCVARRRRCSKPRVLCCVCSVLVCASPASQ